MLPWLSARQCAACARGQWGCTTHVLPSSCVCVSRVTLPHTHGGTFACPAKDRIIFVSAEEEAAANIVEEKDKAPLDSNVSDALGPNGIIDWDCPCLGGMAQGPCGETFKEAFSCFVYSQADPKGSDCIEYFKAMHECVAAHPEVYGGDEEPPSAEGAEGAAGGDQLVAGEQVVGSDQHVADGEQQQQQQQQEETQEGVAHAQTSVGAPQ